MGNGTDIGKREAFFFLTALLAIGTLLRLYGLDQGLWHDELVTAVRYVRIPLPELFFTYDSENQHLFYSILARLFVIGFGETGWALRLPAVLFGVVSLWALYLLGKELSDRREALLSVTLLTFSYHHIWFSQNARGYTGLLFWVTLGSLFLIRGFRTNELKHWILYAVAAALGAYTQLMMILIVAGHFVVYLIWIRDKKGEHGKRRGVLYGFALSGFLTVLLYAPVLPQMLTTVGEESTVLMWKQPLWTLLELIRGMQVYIAGLAVILIGISLLAAGAMSYWRRNRSVVYLLIIPAVVGSIVVLSLGHPLWPRFFFFNAGFASLVLVRGVMVLGKGVIRVLSLKNMNPGKIGTGLCLLLAVLSIPIIPGAWAPKQDYGGVLSFIDQNRLSGDAVLIIGRADLGFNEYYRANWKSVKTVEELKAIRLSASRTWAVYIFPQDAEALYPAVMRVIQQEFPLVRTFDGTLGGGTIYVRRFDHDPGRTNPGSTRQSD